jgi:hypothetical protein
MACLSRRQGGNTVWSHDHFAVGWHGAVLTAALCWDPQVGHSNWILAGLQQVETQEAAEGAASFNSRAARGFGDGVAA